MAFHVEGQVFALLLMGGEDAVEDVQNLNEIVVTEKAGGEFPTIKATLRTQRPELLASLREDHPIVLALGSGDGEGVGLGFTTAAVFVKQKHSVAKSGSNFWLLSVDGIHRDLIGWSAPSAEISDEMSGVERMLELADFNHARATSVDSGGLTASQDRQRWIQHGQPHRAHLQEVWHHCDLPGSFPVLAQTLDGFRLYDYNQRKADGPKWSFSNKDAPSTGGAVRVPYHIVTGIESRSGLFNALGARGQSMWEHGLDAGSSALLESQPSGVLRPHADLDIWAGDTGFPPVPNRRRARSRNVHEKYWEAALRNRTQLGLHSASSVTLSWRGNFQEVHPLDVCEFVDEGAGGQEGQDVDYSGLYVVSRVARSFRDSTFNTSVMMVRESLQ